MFKKLLLTLSALTLLMAGAAFAGDTNWNFYGVGHVSLNMLNNGNDSQLGVTSNTSRFGFKGSTPMNEDFTAFWQFESLVDFAGNRASTSIGERNTFVGMKHATAGKFVFGRHDTPLKALGRKVEFFPERLGDFRSMTLGWDDRLSEFVAWVSPDWDGFSIFAAYMFDQGDIADMSDDDYEAKTAMSAMASYTAEQFMFGAAYEAHSSGFGDDDYFTGEFDDDGNPEFELADSFADAPSALRFVAKYMGENLDIGGMFQSAKDPKWVLNEDDDVVQYDWASTVMGVGACFKVNPQWNVKGAMYMTNVDTDAEDVDGTDVDESDTSVTMLSFGVERVFTENALIYLQYGSISSGDVYAIDLAGSQAGFGTGGVEGSVDDSGEWQDPMGFSVGAVLNW